MKRRAFFPLLAAPVVALIPGACSTKSPNHYFPKVAAVQYYPELGRLALVGGLIDRKPPIQSDDFHPFESDVTVQTGLTTDGTVEIETVPFDTATGRRGAWVSDNARTIAPRTLAEILFAASRNSDLELFEGSITSPAGNVWHGSVVADPAGGDVISVRSEDGSMRAATPETLAGLVAQTTVVYVDRIPNNADAPEGPANYFLSPVLGLDPQTPSQ